ncbi:hypothetical protein [Promicromonospora sp. NPDC050249]|uniref:hypothetical protein n=1 Tax=Promicromonospora sp. NPDC050249 TaxID=3154743 RepID=UPI0033FEEC97
MRRETMLEIVRILIPILLLVIGVAAVMVVSQFGTVATVISILAVAVLMGAYGVIARRNTRRIRDDGNSVRHER